MCALLFTRTLLLNNDLSDYDIPIGAYGPEGNHYRNDIVIHTYFMQYFHFDSPLTAVRFFLYSDVIPGVASDLLYCPFSDDADRPFLRKSFALDAKFRIYNERAALRSALCGTPDDPSFTTDIHSRRSFNISLRNTRTLLSAHSSTTIRARAPSSRRGEIARDYETASQIRSARPALRHHFRHLTVRKYRLCPLQRNRRSIYFFQIALANAREMHGSLAIL